ncbi:3-oxoacyl-[acyl-carrier-protein] reductase [Nocardia seriolae]|uniref:3-oxoacyl-[acyl-carrier-protein] reductase n=1 Tax=Nocardia seriolae TaxID=37332 RepID=A0ABC8B1B6_9NOCA|nr:SDR family oxidoreductase [Nocardia seriolae]APB00299.1 3-oxoacyl-[acyl-carrier-protein] reductase [Nocardia seriolae]
MTAQLDGKIALVTGGARNVGRAIAVRLAADGALVLINHFRSPAAARATKAEIEAAGGRAHIIRASVANAAQRERMFAEITSEFGALDILVNSAADGRLAAFDDVDEAMIDRAIDTNLKGALGCSRLALPLMRGRPGAAIVNVSTLGGGRFVMADYLACGPAKAAVEALTRYLAVEYAGFGIRVNTAAAGMLESPVVEQFPRAEAMRASTVAATPLHRLGTPEEFAAIVAFLASPDAAWVTGQVLLADGGLSTGAALLSPPLADTSPVEVAAQRSESGSPPVQVDAPSPEAVAPVSEALAADEYPEDAIAIVGMGITVSGANDPQEFWRALLDGDQRFETVPPDRWDNTAFHSPDRSAEDKSYSEYSAFITDFSPHPALAAELEAAGKSGAEVESTTLWLRNSVLQAMDSVTRRPSDRCGFLVGYTADGNQHAEEATVVAGVLQRAREVLRRSGTEDLERRMAVLESRLRARYPRSAIDPDRVFPHQVGAAAMAGVLPGDTELLMVDTACSSSLYAVDLGIKGLAEGRYDIAVCGGAFAVGPRGSVLFAKLNGLSERGAVRSFDETGDGVLFSDGAATVVLKTLRRARADGDRILVVVKAFGASSDGKGKAVYAPSAAGQELAVRRAQASPRMTGVIPDWVVAHATGTPAGDAAEFATLRATMTGSEPVRVTSNKSVIGHTGWAAGTSSIIQVLLGFEHELIPPQHRFDRAPAEFMIDASNLEIPKTAVRWPAGGQRPRVAAVSGFGFGGTNAHLVIEEPPRAVADAVPARLSTPSLGPTTPSGRIAVVAAASRLPGASGAREWSAAVAPETTFGDRYPLPTLAEVKLPPGLMRAIDRCQLMILDCARTIRTDLGDFWTAQQAETGVILGHFGSTRNALHYATRCYLDDITEALRTDAVREPWLADVLDEIAAEVRALVPPSTENTFPGMMPNVIPARVANYFGLNGLNMTVDTGFTATSSAIDVAAGYLRTGELRMALAGGINGNATAEQRALLGDLLPAGTRIAEGAFLLALTAEETAAAAGLPILGYLESVTPDLPADFECGAHDGGRPNFLGGEGAFAIDAALRTIAPDGTAVVICRGGAGAPDAAIRVTGPAGSRFLRGDGRGTGTSEVPDTARGDVGGAGSTEHRAVANADASRLTAAARTGGDAAAGILARTGSGTAGGTLVDPHVWGLAPEPGVAVRAPIEFLSGEPTLLLVEDPVVLEGISVPEGTVVLSVRPGPGVRYLPEITPERFGELLDHCQYGAQVRHLRLIADLSGDVCAERTDALRALHDLWFLAARRLSGVLAESGSSTVTLLLHALDDTTPAPYAGLFTGAIKVAALEWPGSATFALVTDDGCAAGSALVRAESMLERSMPVAYYAGGVRYRATLTALADDSAEDAPLDRNSVIVAVGGGRGITAELLVALARETAGRIHVLGSGDPSAVPGRYLELEDAAFAAARREYLRVRRAADPVATPRELSAEFDRMANARNTIRNLRRMREAGAAAVEYLVCDVTDPAAVARAVARVHAGADRIDLLINAAGLNRSARIADKDFGEFRRIRDIKLLGYTNLAAALADRPPRRWCNFGSLLGVTGQIGEVDYASANDFLGTAALSAAGAGRDEFTIGWTLWGDIGLGADELTKSYFEQSGQYSNMPTAEGARHFLRQLRSARRTPYVAHLGWAEYGAVDALLPGFLGPSPRPFYLDRRVARGEVDGRRWEVHERTFDLHRDAYLTGHTVRGVPTLPGAFVAELALEAARALVPGLRAFALEDLTFHHFLKVAANRPVPVRIRAEVLEERADLGQVRVGVEVTGDVIAPNGVVLVRDRRHFSATVLLAATLPAAPAWTPWHPAAVRLVADPYHREGAPVLLTGVFESTTGTALHPLGKRSTYVPRLSPGDPVFSRFRVPVLLLDGLLRTGVLSAGDERGVPIAAPLRIDRLDLYEHTNDTLVARDGPIELYAIVPGPDDAPGQSAPESLFAAVRPDGRIILALKGLHWITTGYLKGAE